MADAVKTDEQQKILGMTPDVFSSLAGGLASALAPPQFGPTGQYIGPSASGQVGALMQQRAQGNMLMQMLKESIGKKGTKLDALNLGASAVPKISLSTKTAKPQDLTLGLNASPEYLKIMQALEGGQ